MGSIELILSTLANWKEDLRDLYYVELYIPNVMANMAGYMYSRQYFIPRAQIDRFYVENDEIKPMAHSVFPFIDNEDFVQGIQQLGVEIYDNKQSSVEMIW